jgi:hypothetical protein
MKNPSTSLRMRGLWCGLALGAASLAAIGFGYYIGGNEFVQQHKSPLLFAAACLTLLFTVGYRLAAGVVRGTVISVRKPKALGQEGAAAAEFVIVVIPFMLMLTALMQLALASMGRVLVSYAAFTAARAAAVIVPMEPKDVEGLAAKAGQAFTDELENNVGYGANTRTDFAISTKASLIRNAASYALIPASPAIDVVVSDTMNNWSDYLANRLKNGLNPLDYLKSLIGDFGAIPAAIADGLADQIKDAIQGGLDSPDQKTAAKNKINDWIDQHITDPSRRQQLKNAADGYIDKYQGSADSPTGTLGNWVKDQINGALSGPLDKFKDAVNQAVDGALAGAGGGVGGGGTKGEAVDRALDVGFGAGTDGAGGAIVRSLRKLVYAKMGTVVTLVDEKGNFKSKFDWNEPIRARVTYLFYCQIPLANRFAGHAFYNLPDSTVADLATGPMKGLTILGIPGHFMTITAEHTFVNQGKPL